MCELIKYVPFQRKISEFSNLFDGIQSFFLGLECWDGGSRDFYFLNLPVKIAGRRDRNLPKLKIIGVITRLMGIGVEIVFDCVLKVQIVF
jgi:hypothetical protein